MKVMQNTDTYLAGELTPAWSGPLRQIVRIHDRYAAQDVAVVYWVFSAADGAGSGALGMRSMGVAPHLFIGLDIDEDGNNIQRHHQHSERWEKCGRSSAEFVSLSPVNGMMDPQFAIWVRTLWELCPRMRNGLLAVITSFVCAQLTPARGFDKKELIDGFYGKTTVCTTVPAIAMQNAIAERFGMCLHMHEITKMTSASTVLFSSNLGMGGTGQNAELNVAMNRTRFIFTEVDVHPMVQTMYDSRDTLYPEVKLVATDLSPLYLCEGTGQHIVGQFLGHWDSNWTQRVEVGQAQVVELIGARHMHHNFGVFKGHYRVGVDVMGNEVAYDDLNEERARMASSIASVHVLHGVFNAIHTPYPRLVATYSEEAYQAVLVPIYGRPPLPLSNRKWQTPFSDFNRGHVRGRVYDAVQVYYENLIGYHLCDIRESAFYMMDMHFRPGGQYAKPATIHRTMSKVGMVGTLTGSVVLVHTAPSPRYFLIFKEPVRVTKLDTWRSSAIIQPLHADPVVARLDLIERLAGGVGSIKESLQVAMVTQDLEGDVVPPTDDSVLDWITNNLSVQLGEQAEGSLQVHAHMGDNTDMHTVIISARGLPSLVMAIARQWMTFASATIDGLPYELSPLSWVSSPAPTPAMFKHQRDEGHVMFVGSQYAPLPPHDPNLTCEMIRQLIIAAAGKANRVVRMPDASFSVDSDHIQLVHWPDTKGHGGKDPTAHVYVSCPQVKLALHQLVLHELTWNHDKQPVRVYQISEQRGTSEKMQAV